MVNGVAFQLLGIIRSPKRLTDTSAAVVIPRLAAQRFERYEPADFSLLVETAGGAARQVGLDLPLVLAPERADPYIVDVPPDANRFRRRVEGNVQALVFAMAALCGLVGAISIASAAYSGVVERTGEFGLRRAFGAKPHHIRSQVVAETILIATGSGLVGELIGFSLSLVIASAKGWILIADPMKLMAILPAACILGAVAGLLPARKASRIEPAVALRQG
jgi:putative ABC transport system permease protein